MTDYPLIICNNCKRKMIPYHEYGEYVCLNCKYYIDVA